MKPETRTKVDVYVIVWQYDVRPVARDEFERAYGPDGTWATLFRSNSDYLGTRLLRDIALPNRYITLDRWRTEEAFLAFMTGHQADYEALDRRFGPLTTSEVRLGAFWHTAGTVGHTPG